MKDIALITIHGMGKEKPNYYFDLEHALKRRMGSDWSRVSFKKVQYAGLLQKPQDALWRKMVRSDDNDLDATKLRKFFLFGFGDAATLEYSAQRNKKKYIEVQTEIQNKLKDAYLELGKDKTKTVIIIAQSLGGQIISNYLWDAERSLNIFANTGGSSNELDFLKLKSLQNLVTTGCNIPLFISGLSVRECFKKPHTKFTWDNYYDPDDVLGWPLRQLGTTFNKVKDHHINSGGLFTSWNPFSHGKYWSDNDVIRPLVNILMNHLD